MQVEERPACCKLVKDNPLSMYFMLFKSSDCISYKALFSGPSVDKQFLYWKHQIQMRDEDL